MSVIPQDAPYSLKADRQALLKAVRNVAHFTNNRSRLVKMEISSDQRMTLYGEDFDFSTEANDRIGIDYSGAKDMTLGVKADSIIDELSRIIGGQHHRRALAHHRAVGHHPLHRPQPCRDHHPRRPALPGRGNHNAAHANAGE